MNHEEQMVRFYERVPIDVLSDACWEWSGAITSTTGYGKVRVDGKAIDTHRAAWVFTHGPIPSGMYICHRCDNRRCVRVSHLFLGTHADNMRDAAEKGRLYSPDNRGSNSPKAKLTWPQVREIRAQYRAGTKQRVIAADFGITRSTVGYIVTNKTWIEEEVSA